MVRSMVVKGVTFGCVVAAGLAVTAPPAAARVFVGLGIGVPGPYYYYPPPVVYAPPPVVYAPPPVVYTAPPMATSQAAPRVGQTCREYHGQTTIDGRQQPTSGTACLQPDGTWRIVN